MEYKLCIFDINKIKRMYDFIYKDYIIKVKMYIYYCLVVIFIFLSGYDYYSDIIVNFYIEIKLLYSNVVIR